MKKKTKTAASALDDESYKRAESAVNKILELVTSTQNLELLSDELFFHCCVAGQLMAIKSATLVASDEDRLEHFLHGLNLFHDAAVGQFAMAMVQAKTPPTH